MKPINFDDDLYDALAAACKRNGEKRVGKFLIGFLRDYGFDTDDFKVVIRIPKSMSSSREAVEVFLGTKKEEILRELFP